MTNFTTTAKMYSLLLQPDDRQRLADLQGWTGLSWAQIIRKMVADYHALMLAKNGQPAPASTPRPIEPQAAEAQPS